MIIEVGDIFIPNIKVVGIPHPDYVSIGWNHYPHIKYSMSKNYLLYNFHKLTPLEKLL